MIWMKTFRAVVVLNLLIVFVQFGFAGQMLSGSDSAVSLHGITGTLLVVVALVQTGISVALRAKRIAPTWVVLTNLGLVLAEAAEDVLGHFHNLALHIPFAVAIFAGIMRQLFWSLQESRAAESRA